MYDPVTGSIQYTDGSGFPQLQNQYPYYSPPPQSTYVLPGVNPIPGVTMWLAPDHPNAPGNGPGRGHSTIYNSRRPQVPRNMRR